MTWQPAAPVALIAVVAIVAIVGLAATTARSHPAASRWVRSIVNGLRALAVAALLIVLLGPSTAKLDEARRDDGPTVAIAFDRSASMGVDDVAPTRHARAATRWLDDEALQRLRAVADARVAAVGDGWRWAAVEDVRERAPDDAQSRIVAGVRGMLRDLDEGDELVLITDGQDTSGERVAAHAEAVDRLAALAKSRGVVVHTVPIGTTNAPPDLALTAYPTAEVLFTDEPVELNAVVERRGFEVGAAPVAVTLSLAMDGEPIDGAAARFGEGRAVRRVRFTHRPAPTGGEGQHYLRYTLRVEPLDGESNATNNERSVFVRVIGRKLRVALFEGRPHWETRFLVEALRHDPRVDLTVAQAYSDSRIAVTRFTPARGRSDGADREDAPLPAAAALTTADGLAGFDVIVLGRGVERFFGGERAEALRRYVGSGGGLLLARGPAFDAKTDAGRAASEQLAEVEPAAWGRRMTADLRLRLDAAARDAAVIDADALAATGADLRRLPHMTAVTTTRGLKATTAVLLAAEAGDAAAGGTPDDGATAGRRFAAVAYHRVGAGRVMAVTTEGLWRWAFRPGANDRGRAVYRGLVHGMVGWLAFGDRFVPGERIDLAVAPMRVEVGEPVAIALSSRYRSAADLIAGGAGLRVTSLGGDATDVDLSPDPADANRAIASYTPTTPGPHEARFVPASDAAAGDGDVAVAPFIVEPPTAELDDVAARPDWLERLAAATGGATLPIDGAAELVERLRDRAAERRRPSVDELRPAWARGWVMAGIVTLFAVEWFVRRGNGLP